MPGPLIRSIAEQAARGKGALIRLAEWCQHPSHGVAAACAHPQGRLIGASTPAAGRSAHIGRRWPPRPRRGKGEGHGRNREGAQAGCRSHWIVLVIGVIPDLAAFSIWAGGQFGRWIGILAGCLSAIGARLSIPGFPLWSVCVFLISVLVVYGLAAYGGHRPGRPDDIT
jgi:hypothetical protein